MCATSRLVISMEFSRPSHSDFLDSFARLFRTSLPPNSSLSLFKISLFMGQEYAPFEEWNENVGLDWELLQYQDHSNKPEIPGHSAYTL